MSSIIFTHGDCDGICAGAVVKSAFPDSAVFFTSPVSLLGELNNLAAGDDVERVRRDLEDERDEEDRHHVHHRHDVEVTDVLALGHAADGLADQGARLALCKAHS